MPDCVFCSIVSGESPAHIVFEDDISIGFLDTRPLFPGHVLLVPRIHVPTLPDLPSNQVANLFANVQMLSKAVPLALEAEGSFVAINNKVSQSVPHLHVHVAPRNRKDGLRGFFWPRNGYESEEHAIAVRNRLIEVINHVTAQG
ncbi:TPA: HIT family protein [Candidatus Latescibacteria bacterium]|nr:HIT family protein [Candidatus Latescibacterota bacterium]